MLSTRKLVFAGTAKAISPPLIYLESEHIKLEIKDPLQKTLKMESFLLILMMFVVVFIKEFIALNSGTVSVAL
jgi:hypothetical protein